MRAALLALALVALPVAAQNGPTVIESIKALQADVAALKADRDALQAEVAALKTRMNVVENSYNIALYYALGHLCYTNTMLSSWSASLVGMKPFPLNGLTCPPEGERIYIPGFIGGQAAVLKPPVQ